MTPAQACYYLHEAMRDDGGLQAALVATLHAAGYTDLYDWAEHEPEQAVLLAESWVGVEQQELSDERLRDLLPNPDP